MADPMSLCNLVFQCWTCIGGPNCSTYVCNLEDNQRSLSDRLEELQDLRNEVKRRAEEAETRGMTRTDQVNRWLHRVEQKEGEAQNMLHQCSQRIAKDCHCLGDYCPKNCCASYKLGQKVALLLSNVLELINQGNDFKSSEVAYRRMTRTGEEVPLPATIKGMDLMFDKVCKCIREDEAAGIIGLYGTGGVGKTTLLKKINNHFLLKTADNSDFDAVIWIVVSRELNTTQIRKKIGDQLGITRKDDTDQVAEATDIFRLLSRQKINKFLLLLDDIWERVDLEEIGIPHPSTVTESNNKSKVIFTTRSEKVCGEMEAKKIIKVECLRDDEAWNLFEEKVGEDTLNCDPDIRQLARDVVKECGGLPLALITIGRAMASKRTRHEWEHAITVLQKSPAKFSGMEEKVFSILKYSYDALPDDKVKSCFLYCSLFPEDYDIEIKGLIEYWIGEGFIKGNEEMREAMNEGYDIIATLKRACLLEPGGNDYFLSKNYVKMHDVIRDMALWIVNDYGRNDKKKHLVVRYEELMDKLIFKWQGANRIFMLPPRPPYLQMAEQQQIKDEVVVPPDEEYPNLIPTATFLVAFGPSKEFPTSSLLRSTKSLRVLDLSGFLFGKVKFPTEIVELVELEYLNLSFTNIKELPYELGNLRKLRYLNLYGTGDLHVVSVEGILKLLDLQYLDLLESNFVDWEMEGRSRLMEVFEALKHLTDFRVTISSDTCLQSWSNSYKLQKYTTALCLGNYRANSFRITTTLDNMFLKTLAFFKCGKLREISWRMETKKGSEKESALRPEILLLEIVLLPKLEIIELPHMCLQNIQYIQINNCMVLEDLTWLRHTHKLERLLLVKLPRLKKIINAEETLIPFSNLEFLYLWDLPALEDIYPGALPLPCLKEIHMVECPKLKKLPFDSNSANNSSLRKIEGSKEWWEALEWDDEIRKSIFQQYFTSEK